MGNGATRRWGNREQKDRPKVGAARMAQLTPKQRSALAKKAAEARWSKVKKGKA
jgi:hypothetical protein